MLHEWFNDLTNVSWGTTLSNRGAMLLKQQGQQTPKRRWYLFHLEFYCHGISQECVQRYKTLCCRRTWLLEWWIIGNTHANRQELCCGTAGTSCTRTIITLSYWAQHRSDRKPSRQKERRAALIAIANGLLIALFIPFPGDGPFGFGCSLPLENDLDFAKE